MRLDQHPASERAGFCDRIRSADDPYEIQPMRAGLGGLVRAAHSSWRGRSSARQRYNEARAPQLRPPALRRLACRFQTPDGRTVTAGPKQPWTWELAEAFRIEHGKIHQIVAIMEHVPYGMSSGWSTWEESMSSKGRDVTN